jgi:soluble lytic murein transglycosylase-like protein
MAPDDLIALAKSLAPPLDPALVCAVIEQESGWNQWLNRYEPDFSANPRYKPTILIQSQDFVKRATFEISLSTEIVNRAMSWGLMQVLGQTARENGFLLPMASLCDAEFGIRIGCKILLRKITLSNGDKVAGLQAWNGGANPNYAAEVMAREARYQQ